LAAPFDVRPPNAPWLDLSPIQPPEGYVTYYYSDDLSRLPVRAVTKPGDNKADPNLETGTYGLFSTCAHGMRASIVNKRYEYLFFLTRRNSRRVLTGFYRMGWFVPGTLNRIPPDYALAASEVHFVDPGIAAEELPPDVAHVVARPFRIFKRVDVATTATLLEVLREKPNCTAAYLSEIDRLERFNRFRTDQRYVGWGRTEPFGWESAAEYLRGDGANTVSATPVTTSPTDVWQCSACGEVVRNKALLRRCPQCRTMDSLVPVPG
jgi:hypothetical protein